MVGGIEKTTTSESGKSCVVVIQGTETGELYCCACIAQEMVRTRKNETEGSCCRTTAIDTHQVLVDFHVVSPLSSRPWSKNHRHTFVCQEENKEKKKTK